MAAAAMKIARAPIENVMMSPRVEAFRILGLRAAVLDARPPARKNTP